MKLLNYPPLSPRLYPALTEIPWTPHVQRVLASQFQAPAGYPREPEQVDLVRTMATRLKVPAVVSHSSAGVVHELPLPVRLSRLSTVHVTVSRLDIRPSRRGLNVHVGEISPCDYQEFDGIPVTSPQRVIADLAHLLTLPELNVLLDQAMNLSWKHYGVHFGEQFTQDQVNDLLAQVLSRKRFHGRRNIMQLIEFRERFTFPVFEQPWQSYVAAVISAGYRVTPALNTENHSAGYLSFPSHRSVIPQPFRVDDDRAAVRDRTEEFVTLRCHGYHTVILTWTDLLSDQRINHQYESTRHLTDRATIFSAFC
jgi:hypothetical protein